MHPMFVKLYLEPDADDLPAEDEAKRRAANRARRAGRAWLPGPLPATRIAARDGDLRPRITWLRPRFRRG